MKIITFELSRISYCNTCDEKKLKISPSFAFLKQLKSLSQVTLNFIFL